MSRLTFIGLGLHSEMGITLEGLAEAMESEHIFAEFYTSYMPGIDIANLEKMTGRKIKILSRKDVEEEAQEKIFSYANKHPCAFLTPGDPNIATTHIDLRLRAEKAGIKTSIIHAASISSAISGATGLQSYKFSRTVTIPFKSNSTSETPYDNIWENKLRGLHTLALLDLDAENKKYMTIPEGLTQLLEVEERRNKGCVTLSTLIVGLARVGSEQMLVKADTVKNLIELDWGDPPQCLVFLGNLHFMEIEALEILCKARKELLEGQK